jgi:hypothetical protein
MKTQSTTIPAGMASASARSLSDLKNRSENSAGRGQILPVLQVNSHSIDQKSGEIWTAQADLQPISFKSDRLLEISNSITQLSLYRPPESNEKRDILKMILEIQFLLGACRA